MYTIPSIKSWKAAIQKLGVKNEINNFNQPGKGKDQKTKWIQNRFKTLKKMNLLNNDQMVQK